MRTAAGSHDDVGHLTQRRQPGGDRAHPDQVVPHALDTGGRHVVAQCGLVAGHPDQPKPRAGHRGRGHRVGGGVVATAGAGARRAELDADVDRTPGAGGLQRLGHQRHPANRVHPADQPEIGIAVEFGGQPGQPRGVDQFVGQHHLAHPERPVGPHLADRRGRHRARAGVELPGQQLRRHVGLAVRRELDAVPRTPAGHRGQVVAQRLGGQDTHRSQRSGVEQVGRAGTDLRGGRPDHAAGRPLNRQSTRSSARAATAAAFMRDLMTSFKLARRELC